MAEPVITGTWIDVVHGAPRDGVYWNRKTLAYTREEWATLVRHLKRDLGITLLMIQNVAKDGLSCYPSKVMDSQWRTGCDDPIGAILETCGEEGIDCYPGIGFHEDAFSGGLFSEKSAQWHHRVSEEILERYGDRPSFTGWYTTAEMCIADGKFNS